MSLFTPKYSVLFVIASFLFSLNAAGQANGSLETWLPSGRPAPFDWKFPQGWSTNNATTEFSGAGVSQSPDEHSGSWAARLRTLNLFGTITRSQLVLGNCKLDFPNYRILPITGGEPLLMEPKVVSFFINYLRDLPLSMQ